MAEVLFYERPVPLNRSEHKDLRIKNTSDLGFAAKVHSVPLTVFEFAMAARDFPILFAGNNVDEAGPVAMLGLRQGENLFVDANGHWEQGTYMPAFVRRYPFVLAEKPPGAPGDEFTVFLDEAHAGFSKEEGNRLFNEDGSDTELLTGTVKFLGEFQESVKRSRAFTVRLRELDLLEQRTVQLKRNEETTVVNGLFVVNEEKLRKLDEKTAHAMLVEGTLGWVYAHLLSLANIERLQLHLNKRADAEAAQASEETAKAD